MDPKSKKYRPVILAIIDGLGIPQDKTLSTWELASHPNFLWFEKNFPFSTIQASGIAVGLPWGEAGNSEVGHLTIGAGKIIYNYLPKISRSIKDGSFFTNESFKKAVEHVKTNESSLHLVGLFSTGTVHAYFEHLYALLELSKINEIKNTYLHLFTDGKDAHPEEAENFYANFEVYLSKNYPNVKVASLVGRNFAMDRNGNWDKTKRAYALFVESKGNEFESSNDYINSNYKKGVFDESIEPASKKGGEGRIKNNDSVIFFNFREDSMRQLAKSFCDNNFSHFERMGLSNLFIVTMTEYEKGMSAAAAFKSADVGSSLPKIISDNKLKQLHIAETEKYAHITYFLNGGVENSMEGEDRILISSPSVTSYDKTPEMSADKITSHIAENLKNYDFIAANFANADMVGHTGNLAATTKAIETIDKEMGKLAEAVLKTNGALIITADHGNAEEKLYAISGEKKTKHSTNPVPFFIITNDLKKEEGSELPDEDIEEKLKTTLGTLADVAPTILDLLGISKPEDMTGKSLFGKIT